MRTECGVQPVVISAIPPRKNTYLPVGPFLKINWNVLASGTPRIRGQNVPLER